MRLFWWRSAPIVAGCCLVALGCAAQPSTNDQREAPDAQTTPSPSPSPSSAGPSPSAYDGKPRIVFRNTQIGPSYGLVAEVPLSDPAAPRALTGIACDRIDATIHGASCLTTKRGVDTSYAWLDLGPDFSERASSPLEGTPNRTRMSADGRLVASTVFVAGHSYGQSDLSTATEIRKVGGKSYGNLEGFRLYIDGKRVLAEDRNIWGVTFVPDSDTFYATAKTGGTPYLVEGDLSARTLTAVRSGPECPSLSPDGTRVAYKLATGSDEPPHWSIAVLDLRTRRQTVLGSERRSVDDQVAWLNDRTLLYGLPRPSEAGVSDVWAVDSHGGDAPRKLITNAWSPAVVR